MREGQFLLQSPVLKKPERGRNVTAVLGPTNTGKTHLAIDRMLARRTGVIGLPLRLLAREVYGRIVARIGPDEVALITGEEKILPPKARYYVATVEAMPLDLDAEFVAIDEVQLAADLERGRVFTDRLLRVRGRYETLLLGALTARNLLERLIPGINVVTRPRMSMLTYAGQKKLTRLPPRSAVVAFSANEVYAIAELIRRQRGGAAIVMGALSPRTRNAQVELFQSGDVDFLIATDAIGMGLNLDVDHVAFASNRKFDGYQFRALSAAELGQIAGRAGRHTRDGTFGVTGRVAPFENELVEALETHAFQPARVFQWRNAVLDFSSVAALRASLDEPAQEEGLTKALPADDQKALEHATKTPDVMDLADTPDRVERLWEVCQVPDYRKIAPANHADLLLTLYQFLIRDGAIADEWIARQVRYADRIDGDIDTLSNRIAHIRTWTFVANRNDWLHDPQEWRETTRQVEDRLSDALHERLMQRFVDRRTSVLMKRLRENAMLEAEVNDAGDVIVEGQHVGVLYGFRFQADASSADPSDQKALRAAAAKALAKEIERRADKVATAPDAAFALGSDAGVRWQGALIGKITPSDDALKPGVVLLADETLSQPARERVQGRLQQWLAAHIEGLLKPLFDLRVSEGLDGSARGLAYRISENLGSVERASVADEAKALEQSARAGLRALGVRFGAYHIFVPALLKPAPSQLLALLWALKNADLDVKGLQEVPQLSASGRTSIPVDPEVPVALYGVVGFRVCGPRAVRIDILERLADQIRPLVAWRPGPDAGDPPPGAVPSGGAFLVTVTMTSLLGCSGDDFAAVLSSLGYRVDRREANEAEREAIAAAQQVRRAPQRRSGRPLRESESRPGLTASASAPAPGDPAQDGAPQPAEAVDGEGAVEAAAASDVAEMQHDAEAPGDHLAADGMDSTPAEADAAPSEGSDAGQPAAQAEADETPSTSEAWRQPEHSEGGEAGVKQQAPDGVTEAAVEPLTFVPEGSAPEDDGAVAAVEADPAGEAELEAAQAGEAELEAAQAGEADTEAAQAAEADMEAAQAADESAEFPSAAEGQAEVAPASDAEAEGAQAEEAQLATGDAGPAGEALEDRPQEASAEEGAADEAASQAEAADAAPVIIEIWRVPRHQRADQANRRRRGGGAQRPGQEAADSRRRPRRHGQGAQGGEGRENREGHGAARAAEGASGPGQGAAPSAGGAPAGASGSPANTAAESGDRRGDRGPRKGKKRGKQPQPRNDAPKPARREREADPDSPFAALAALKEKMETGSSNR